MNTQLKIIPFLFLLSCVSLSCNRNKPVTPAANSLFLEIPSVKGPLVIDGIPDEEIWKNAPVLKLKNDISENGGEARIFVREGYLCLSAVIPESDRPVAHSTGLNPSWWREDMIRWMFRFKSPLTGSNMVGVLTLNSLGAASMGAARDIYNLNRNEFLSLTPVKWSGEIISAANTGADSWKIEAAIPMKYFDFLGFLSLERIRVPRVNSPEISWYWPAENVQAGYKAPPDTIMNTPVVKAVDLNSLNSAGELRQPLTSLAKDVESLPKQAWSPEEQKSLGVKELYVRSLQKRIAASALEEKEAFQKIKTTDDWKTFRRERLDAMMKWIGPLPERTNLKPAVTGRIDQGKGYVIENLLFESRPGLIVTANLYVPGKISGHIPAIVVVHSHHAPKIQSELQDMGMTWAKSGVAVLVMDQLCAGERIQSQPWSRESYYGRYALGNQLYLGGESLIKWMAWDIIRGIDLLTERKFIDRSRIILMGAVAGGGDPAALAATLDHRIAAVIPFNFGEAGPEEHYTEGPRKYDFETADPGWAFWETTRNLPKSVSGQYFPWFICASGAPRNFIYSFELGWPGKVDDEPAWARYKKVYGLFGEQDRLATVSGFGPFPGPGECTNVGTYLRQQLYPILNKWFEIPVPEVEIHNILPESALMCLTSEAVSDRKLKPAALVCLDLAGERLAKSRSRLGNLPENERNSALCNELEQKLGDIRPDENLIFKKLSEKQFSDFKFESWSIETDPGILVPFYLLTPKDLKARRPAVMAIAEGGKGKFLALCPGEIANFISQGITVCLPDVRNCGEIASSDSRGPGAMSPAATELMLGGSLTGLRLKDTRSIFHWLSERDDIDPGNIAIWGDSFTEPNAPGFRFFQSPGQQQGPVPQRQAEPSGPFLALLTGLYEGSVKAIACRRGLISFSSLLEDNFCNVPQDVIVPGLLETCDIRDIIKGASPRKVLLAGTVDGLNREASMEMMEKEYGNNFRDLEIKVKPDDLQVSSWLGMQLKQKP